MNIFGKINIVKLKYKMNLKISLKISYKIYSRKESTPGVVTPLRRVGVSQSCTLKDSVQP